MSTEAEHISDRLLPADDVCRRARLSRDVRFDGVFFTVVKTTGIFCRPVCPVAPPLEKNVFYVPSAAEAFQLGYRPCLRCRPETAPMSAAWLGNEAIAARVIRAVNQGQLQHVSVTQLAERMGISERYLRKLCQQYAGASPVQMDQARRSLLAKQLLFDSNLSITEIAFASGYQSVRRFNEHWKQQFGQPPSAMRKRQASDNEGRSFKLYLTAPENYDFESLLAFFRLRQLHQIERVSDEDYQRSIRLSNGDTTVIKICFNCTRKRLELSLATDALIFVSEIVVLVKRLFDLEAPVSRILSDLASDPNISIAIDRLSLQDLRLPGTVTPFEAIFRAIVGQQVSVKAAITILNRILLRLYGEDSKSEVVLKPFPDAEDFTGFNFDGLGLPQARINTLTSVVDAFIQQPRIFEFNADPEVRRNTLLEIKGIGPWTVNYLEMRAYAMPDAFPAGDLIVRQSYSQLINSEKILTEKQLLKHSENWQPWRAYATLLLWQFYNAETATRS